MTDPAVCRRLLLLPALPRYRYEPRFRKKRVTTDNVEMSLVRKMHCELADGISSWPRGIVDVAQTRKQKAHSVARSHRHVAIGADAGSGRFAREELLAVATKTRCMFRKFGDVRVSIIALTNFLPIRSGKLMAPITLQLFFCYVSGVRKLGVIGAGLLRCSRRATAGCLCASLWFNSRDRPNHRQR